MKIGSPGVASGHAARDQDPPTPSQAQAMTPAAFEDVHWRSRDGLRLHARRYAPDAGHGSGGCGTVVCIPGLTRNAADFDAPAREMAAAGWQVFAVDLRGRAGSQRAGKPRSYNPRTYADDVAALLDDRGVASAVFVGTSLGVLVTMTLAVRRPDLVAAAVLNDAGPEVPREALDRIGRYAGKAVPPMDRDAAAGYVESIARETFPGYGPDDWRAMVERMFRVRDDGLLELDYDPAIVRTVNPWLLRLMRPLLWRAWRKLGRGRPLLVLRGELSDVLTAAVARRMVQQADDARLVEVPGVGHAPMLVEPEARGAIATFLARMQATA